MASNYVTHNKVHQLPSVFSVKLGSQMLTLTFASRCQHQKLETQQWLYRFTKHDLNFFLFSFFPHIYVVHVQYFPFLHPLLSVEQIHHFILPNFTTIHHT